MMLGITARATIILALPLFACTPTANGIPAGGDASAVSSLSAEERAAGWRPLFDGTGTSEWRGYHEQTFPSGWHIVDGVLTKTGSVHDIITRDQFGNFELALDWSLSPSGNSGVFYRGTEEYEYIFWSAPEYQLLDDAGHPDGKSRLTSAGSAFALYPSPASVVKPAGRWNSTLIIVNGGHVEHWMNGQKLLEYELGSPDWEARVKASKFKDWPHFGSAPRGHVAIQGDHDGTLSIRNVRVREIR